MNSKSSSNAYVHACLKSTTSFYPRPSPLPQQFTRTVSGTNEWWYHSTPNPRSKTLSSALPPSEYFLSYFDPFSDGHLDFKDPPLPEEHATNVNGSYMDGPSKSIYESIPSSATETQRSNRPFCSNSSPPIPSGTRLFFCIVIARKVFKSSERAILKSRWNWQMLHLWLGIAIVRREPAQVFSRHSVWPWIHRVLHCRFVYAFVIFVLRLP